MGNRLLNGVGGEETPPPLPSSSDTRIWQYRENGEAKLFSHINEVPKGEGWADNPDLAKALKKNPIK